MQRQEPIISHYYSLLHDKFNHGIEFITDKFERLHVGGNRRVTESGFNEDLDPSIDDLPITLNRDPGPGKYSDLQ